VLRRLVDSWPFTILVAILMVVLVVNNVDAFEKMVTLLFTWEP
jgi:hypothetical protein